MLMGLGALAVPLIIHLMQRRKVVPIPFSTLRFLKLVKARTSRRSHIENLLLLILRCLIFALILLAAARPVISPKAAGWWGGNVPRTIVLVLDDSLSMNYKAGDETRFETAKKQALAVLDDLKPGDDVAVILANDRAQLLIAEPTMDYELAKQAVRGAQQTQFRTDFSPALREARKIMGRSQKRVKRIYLVTDNQEGGWQFDPHSVFDELWQQSGAQLTVVRPDALESMNAAVTKVNFRSPFVTAGATVRGSAKVENFSAAEFHDLLEVKLGDQRVAQRPVDIAANSSVDLDFEFPMPVATGDSISGTASIQSDHLPDDDRQFFWLSVYQPPRVLIVEGEQVGPESLHSGFFLRKALAAGGDVTPTVVSSAELDDLPLEGYSAVFLADVILSDRAVVRLDHLLQRGGTVAFFFGDHSDPANLARIEFMPAKPLGLRELPSGRMSVRALEPRHPLSLERVGCGHAVSGGPAVEGVQPPTRQGREGAAHLGRRGAIYRRRCARAGEGAAR